jgi:hypothetical protein
VDWAARQGAGPPKRSVTRSVAAGGGASARNGVELGALPAGEDGGGSAWFGRGAAVRLVERRVVCFGGRQLKRQRLCSTRRGEEMM